MKKIFNLTLPIGILILLFVFFHSPDRAFGADKSPSIGIEEQNKTEQVGPPWYNESWHYRRPIVITNYGTTLSYYQVLITLNSGNFIFNLASPGGQDIRFTHSDGTTELNYWIEYWSTSTQWAYIWVRVPSIATGDTTIYLYYNNPGASSQSNGSLTFDSFDDNWSHFASEGFNLVEETEDSESVKELEAPFSWSTISGSPSVSNSNLILDGAGIKSTSLYLYQAVGYRAIFGSGAGHEWGGFIDGSSGKQTRIGDNPDKNNMYLMNYVSAPDNISIPRVGGKDWHDDIHVYEIRWKAGQSIANIDHTASSASSTSQIPSTSLPVTLYSDTAGATLTVDWVYVRQYRDPEPTSTVGAEQGLVDLGINMVDSPDPIHTGAELSYLLTISNNSIIDAPGVIVTDTLPGSVQFVRANPSLGCSHVASDVICSLNTIDANSTASVTIVVNPTVDGVITNTVTIGSPGFDLDMSNNTSQAATLVDSVPPNVNWENPVHNGQKYTTSGGFVTLVASATDNDQVAWVEFWYWNHIKPIGKKSIGIDNIYPYQMQFNSNLLVPNEEYQVFIQAADRAGNISDIYKYPYPVIYFTRISLYFLYLPLAVK
jgi:uncharacterized repeat protein (TIGR01451 family)